MERIEKLTTQPCRGPFDFESLNLHLNGRTKPIRIISGRADAIKAIRKHLEDDLVLAIEKAGTSIDQRRLWNDFNGDGITIGLS